MNTHFFPSIKKVLFVFWWTVTLCLVNGAPESTNLNTSKKTSGIFARQQMQPVEFNIIAALDHTLYSIVPGVTSESAYTGYNIANCYEVNFGTQNIRLKPTSQNTPAQITEAIWTASKWGYEGQLQPLDRPELHVDGTRIEYQRGTVTEWYVNGKDGMEQGFTINTRPTGDVKEGKWVEVQMELSGNLTPEMAEKEKAVWLKDVREQKVIKYGGLYAYDNKGKELSSKMLLVDDHTLALQVDDQNAEYPITIDPKFNMGDSGSQKDSFGYSVDINGDRLVVGVPGFRHGIAIVFVKDSTAANGWKEEAKLIAPWINGKKGESFGHAVTINGNTIAVGDMGSFDVSLQEGAASSVYVFIRNDNNWIFQQRLQGDEPKWGDGFGYDIDLDQDLLVVGAPGNPWEKCGAYAYLFERKVGAWSQAAKVSDPDSSHQTFGLSVAIAGQIFAVGAECKYYYMNLDNYPIGAGAVYIFSPYLIGTGAWTLEQKLIPDEPIIWENAYFGEEGLSKNYGWDVDIKQTSTGVNSNDKTIYTVAVGMPDNSHLDAPPEAMAYDYGAVYIFERTSLAFNPWQFSWSQTQKLQASDKDQNHWQFQERFGYSVAVSPDRIVVGAPDAEFWFQQFNFAANTGAVYAFEKQNPSWIQLAKIYDPDHLAGDNFGFDVAVDQTTGLFGIPLDDILHTGGMGAGQQGSAWVEELNYFSPRKPGSLSINTKP